MAVVIRLARMGKTHKPFYRISVADSRAAATGKFLEQIGHYDPNVNPPAIEVNEESAIKWMKNGARPSDTVRSLFYRQGIMEKFALVSQGKGEGADLKARESLQAKKPKVHKKAKEKAEAAAKAAAEAKAAEEKAAAEAKAAAAAEAEAAKAAAAEEAAAAAASAEAPAADEEKPAG